MQPSWYNLFMVEPLFTINELVGMHRLSRQTVIRLYEKEFGIQVLQAAPEHRRKVGRRYRTIRVPKHVYERVVNRLQA